MSARIHAILTSLLRGNMTARILSFECIKQNIHEGWRPAIWTVRIVWRHNDYASALWKQDSAMAPSNLNCSNCLAPPWLCREAKTIIRILNHKLLSCCVLCLARARSFSARLLAIALATGPTPFVRKRGTDTTYTMRWKIIMSLVWTRRLKFLIPYSTKQKHDDALTS